MVLFAAWRSRAWASRWTCPSRLEGSRLSFKVVEGSLREKLLEDDKKGYMLKSVTFMPFLGSSYGADIDGYMLIPDGTGALIRFP